MRTLPLLLALTACVGDGDKDTTPDDTGTKKPSDTPPVASIDAPTGDDISEIYDGRDDKLDLWYVDVTLEGSAADAEDGALTGASLEWTTDRGDIQDAQLGTGTDLTVRLYSDDCFGVIHEITLSATDSDGNTSTDTVEIFIYTVC